MNFADTYQHEVLQSRQDRSRRAFFWARIVGFVLMITIGATLRADPELRAVLIGAGMDGVAKVANLQNTDKPSFSPTAQAAPQSKPRIKINRPGEAVTPPSNTQDTTALAQELARAMSAQKIGN